MTLHLTAHLPLAGALALGMAAGLAAGLLHFRLLAWNAGLFARGRPAAALGLQLLRMAAIAAVLALLARTGGAAAVAAALAGILAARTWALRGARREAPAATHPLHAAQALPADTEP